MEMRGIVNQQNDSPGRYEKLFAMLLDAIPSSVLLINRDMRIVSVNRNFLQKSRRTILNTINQRLEEVFPAIILDQMDILSRINQVFEMNRPTTGERMIYRAPGIPMRIYYYSILPFSWKGMVESAMLLMDDVTEQVRLSEEVRRMERHLASVVESASDIVLSTDTQGRILTWNAAGEKLSGYILQEVRETFFFKYFAEDQQEKVKQLFFNMKTGRSSQMAEWSLVTRQGKFIPISWVLSPMKDELAQTVGIVAVGRDLTEHRKLEIQVLQSQKLAALGVMAGGIAHEIRNPLAVCSSSAQFLMDDGIDQHFRKECANKIQAGIQKASNIIENLLKFARPSPETDMTEVDLNSVLKETAALVANQAKIQKIELSMGLPVLPVIVKGNASLLQQVFMNLFLNAINAMPDGGTLTLSLERLPGEVFVHISDTGHGISREDIDKIFDPFYMSSPVKKGTGLGLSLCYSLVKQHSGSIEVESIKGKGSNFTVRLHIH